MHFKHILENGKKEDIEIKFLIEKKLTLVLILRVFIQMITKQNLHQDS